MTVIDDKLNALPSCYKYENEVKKKVCWSVFNKCEKMLSHFLQVKEGDRRERLRALKLIATISSCKHEPLDPNEIPDFSMMFANEFLEPKLADD